MPPNKGILRCNVKCGAFNISDVPLPAEVVEAALEGNYLARKQIVDKFINHLKLLPILRLSDNTEEVIRNITFEKLVIIPPIN